MSRKPDLQKLRPASPPLQAGPRLARVIAGLLRQVNGDLTRLQDHPEVAIHALRRRMKKLHSLLLLIEPLTDLDKAKQIKRLLLELKNAFAGQRDQDVMAALALKMGGRPLAHQFPRLEEFNETWVMTGCHAAAAALESILTTLPIRRFTWAELKAVHNHTLMKATRSWRKTQENPTAVHLHECRKKTKVLYYQLLFLRLLKGQRKRKIRQARELGRWLGRHHDLHVFQKTLQERRLLRRSLKKSVEQREKKLRHRCLESGEKFYDKD